MSTGFKLFHLFNQTSSVVAPAWAAKYAVNLFITPRRFRPKEWELEHEKTATRFQVKEGLSALRWKPSRSLQNGKKVLLVHGWEGRATQMASFVPSLLDQGYEVLTTDMPGHGHSTGKQSDIAFFADAIIEMEAQEGQFDTVIAHSMGGPSTAWAVKKGLNVNNLIFVSSPSRMDMVLKRFAGFIGLRAYAADLFVEFMSKHVGISARDIDTVKLLENYQGRLMLVHDEGDQEVSVFQSQRVADEMSEAELIITQNLGHRRILGSEEIIAKTTSFIEKDILSDTQQNTG
ncbi:MAG: alpha/beta hydrolase [Methyloligellaceae bacterium]